VYDTITSAELFSSGLPTDVTFSLLGKNAQWTGCAQCLCDSMELEALAVSELNNIPEK